ncbi:unnamed protein product [Arabidopsis halleri]
MDFDGDRLSCGCDGDSSRRGLLASSVVSFSSESCCWVSEICRSGGCSVLVRLGEVFRESMAMVSSVSLVR